jgi:hypothetical protein
MGKEERRCENTHGSIAEGNHSSSARYLKKPGKNCTQEKTPVPTDRGEECA